VQEEYKISRGKVRKRERSLMKRGESRGRKGALALREKGSHYMWARNCGSGTVMYFSKSDVPSFVHSNQGW